MTGEVSTGVRERPIVFSGEMVAAIFDGRKTVTRRVMKPQPMDLTLGGRHYGVTWMPRVDGAWYAVDREPIRSACPHGKPGDRLWVKETWSDAMSDDGPVICYRANLDRRYLHFDAWPIEYERYPGCQFANWASDLEGGIEGRWRSSRFMPRWASRITLEVVEVRVERLQSIGEADALAEGIRTDMLPACGDHPDLLCYVSLPDDNHAYRTATEAFCKTWESINGKRPGCSWEADPWVWVVVFRRIATREGVRRGG